MSRPSSLPSWGQSPGSSSPHSETRRALLGTGRGHGHLRFLLYLFPSWSEAGLDLYFLLLFSLQSLINNINGKSSITFTLKSIAKIQHYSKSHHPNTRFFPPKYCLSLAPLCILLIAGIVCIRRCFIFYISI